MGLNNALNPQQGGKVKARTLLVSGTATGVIANVLKYLPQGATWTKSSGLAGVTIASNGDASVAAAIGVGVSVTGVVAGSYTDAASKVQTASYTLTLTGAAVAPAAPSVTLTPGNGSVSIAYVNGATGGAAITSNRIYAKTSAGVTLVDYVATDSDGSPYELAWPNGDDVFICVTAVNAAGLESPLSVERSATPTTSFTKETLTIVTEWGGSSSIAGENKSSTLNVDGNPVPVEIVGKAMQDFAMAQFAAGSVAFVTRASTGKNSNQVATQFDAALGTIGGRLVISQFGGNHILDTPSPTEFGMFTLANGMYDNLIASGVGAILAWTAFVTSSNSHTAIYKHAARMRKKFKALGGAYGVINMNETLMKWTGSGVGPGLERTSTDATLQWRKSRPNTFVENPVNVHNTSLGHKYLAETDAVPVIGAHNGGPVKVADNDYYGKVTGPAQKVCNLNYFGTLTGQSFSVDNAAFTLVPNGSVLELWLTGAAPGRAWLPINITATKVPYAPRVSEIHVSVSARAANDNAVVRFDGRAGLAAVNGFWTAASRKFTLFFAGAFREYTPGANPDQPVTSADNNAQSIINTTGGGGLQIQRRADGGWLILCTDSGGSTRAFTVTSTGSHRINHGLRGLAVCFDGDAGIFKVVCTAGYDLSGNFYAQTVFNGSASNVPGNGTANITATEMRLFVNSLFGSSSSTTREDFFQGDKHMLWGADEYLDMADPAVLGQFYEPGTHGVTDRQRVKSLGATGVVNGVTPELYLPGDAAELLQASTVAFDDAVAGFNTGKNHGTGGDLFPSLWGTVTTIAA